MAWSDKVVWSEGMFLLPQHLQQHERHLLHLLGGTHTALSAYGWGFSELVIDRAALAMGKLALASARGILPDGTPFELPGTDAAPLPLDIPSDLKDARVMLGAPLRRPEALEADVEGRDTTGLVRYAIEEVDVGDSTLVGLPTARLQLGRLRLLLMAERDGTGAHAALPVARVAERRADDSVVLDKQFIAPMLAVSGDAQLARHVAEITAGLHAQGAVLAERVAQPGAGGVAEVADFLLLQVINRFEPLMRHLGAVQTLHPAQLYAQLVMLAGELCTFTREQRRPPAYPPYAHGDLHTCFAPVVADIHRSLSYVPERSAIPIELQERRYGVRVAVVPDAELLRGATFVLAVNAQLPGEVLRSRFASQAKLGPAERIRDLVNLALPGIGLRALPVAPRQLPFHAGFTYFELERSGEMWAQLQQSAGLALHVSGDFPGLELELWALRA